MGVFTRRDSPYWQLLLERARQKPIRIPTKIRHTTGFPKLDAENKQLAEVAYHQKMNALAKGELGLAPGHSPTLANFWKKTYLPWLKQHYPKAVAETTRVITTLFLPTLGDRQLDQIRPAQVKAWLDGRTGVTPQSKQRELSHLRGLLSRAVEWEVLTVHPLADLALDAAPTREIVRYLTADEEASLMAALTKRDDDERAARERANAHRLSRKKAPLPPLGIYMDALHPMVILSVQTGMRRGEVFQLSWSAIDWQAKVVTVEWWTTKRNRRRVARSRRLPLNAAALTALKAWREQCPTKATLVFPSPKTGKALTNVQSSWEDVLTDAGILNFRWHDLRHTFASKLVQRGVSLYVVQKLLGHESITTTMRYAHLAPDQGRHAVDLLSEAGS